jgi:hypothetical protein
MKTETKREFLKRNTLNWGNFTMERKIEFLRQRRVSFLTIMAASCLFTAFVSPANAEWQNGGGNIKYNLAGFLNIWDISGTYFDTFQGIDITYVITQDTSGKLTGTGQARVTSSLNLPFDVKGAVGTNKDVVWVKMTLKGKGATLFQGEPIKLGFSAKVNAQVVSGNRTMIGTVKTRVSALGNSWGGTEIFDKSLPADMNGAATLDLSTTSNLNKIFGKGILTLSNDVNYTFDVIGKFNQRTNESLLTLKGGKNNLKIKIDDIEHTLQSLKGKVLGQKLVLL